MRALEARPILCLLLAISVSPEVLAAPSLDQAKKDLESARAGLTAAVERIQKEPPSNADLDSALEAVKTLKKVIDAGAELEPKDLEYAKLALAARKQLRKDREYVKSRRAATHIHERRRAIDQAFGRFQGAASRILGPTNSTAAKDFELARSAQTELERELAQGKDIARQDASFAKYAAEVSGKVSELQDRLAARSVQLLAKEQRSKVEADKRALDTALAAVAKEKPSDGEFDAADRAMSTLMSDLAAGVELEKKDSSYRGYAGELRSALSKARKQIDAAWRQTALARMKAEIEPALKDLVQAGRLLSGKSAKPEQVAEARTAAIVVRKLLEKFERRKIEDPELARFLKGARGSLLEVEVALLRRKLDPAREAVAASLREISRRDPGEKALASAEKAVKDARLLLGEGEALAKEDRGFSSYFRDFQRALSEADKKIRARKDEILVEADRRQLDQARDDLRKALANLERRSPSDEQFGEAKTAAIVLEKTLEAEHPRDSKLASYLRELRSFLGKAKKTMEKRRETVEAERQRSKVDTLRREVAALARGVGARDVTTERLDEVEAAQARLESALAEGAPIAKKDRAYAQFDRDIKKQIAETRSRVSKRRQDLAVEAAKAKVAPALEAFEQAIASLDNPLGGEKALRESEARVGELERALAAGQKTETELKDYKTWADRARVRLTRGKGRLAKRQLELEAETGRGELEKRGELAKAAVQTAKQPGAGPAEIAAATSAVQALLGEVEKNEKLEEKHRGYASAADRARGALGKLGGDLQLARSALAFRQKTLELLSTGSSAAETAESAQDLRKKKEAFERAVLAFRSCGDEGRSQLGESPALTGVVVAILEGAEQKPKQILELCAGRLASSEPELSRVSGLVAFEDGPKAFFEKGEAFLADGRKEDARKQFEECIFSGRVLSHKNPELKEQKLPVGGRTMTLTELVNSCVKRGRELKKG